MKADKYGDFEEVKEENQGSQEENSEHNMPARVRMPRNKEVIGMIVQRFGGNKMEVITTEEKHVNCRVPGRYKRKLWLRPKDIVLVSPWEFDKKKGDIIYKYSSSEINQLKKRGIIEKLKSEF